MLLDKEYSHKCSWYPTSQKDKLQKHDPIDSRRFAKVHGKDVVPRREPFSKSWQSSGYQSDHASAT